MKPGRNGGCQREIAFDVGVQYDNIDWDHVQGESPKTYVDEYLADLMETPGREAK